MTANLNAHSAQPPPAQRRAGLSLIFVVLWCLILAAAAISCTAPLPTPAATPTPAASPTPVLQPVTVTEIVTQEIVVTATPAPLAACAPADLAGADQMVIGVLAPFSQNSAWPRALAMQAGVGLALEDVNGAGGVHEKPLAAIMRDTTGDPGLAAQLAETLVTQDCASALIGGFSNEEAAAIKEVSTRYGVPFLIVEATADDLTSDLPPAVFRLSPADTMIAEMPALWLNSVGDYNGDGGQQVLLIAVNSASADAALERVNGVFGTFGIAYDVLRVDAPADDYSSLIARIVARERMADVIMLYMTGDAALDLLRQLLDAGIGPQKGTLLVAGRAALDGAQFWSRVPDGAFTVISRRGPWHTSVTPLGTAFAERYAAAYAGQWPEPAAFAAYDGIHLLADAARRAGSISPEALVGALETADITLAAGYYHFPVNSRRPPAAAQEPAYRWHQWANAPLLYMQYSAPQQDPATIDIIWPPAYHTVDTVVLRP